MRILQVCAVDFTAFHLLRPLMLGLRNGGWSVEFACADGPGAVSLREDGFRHRPVPMSRAMSPIKQTRAMIMLALSIRGDPPDIIHTHTPAGGLVGRAAAVLAGHHAVAHTFHGLPFGPGPLGFTERAFLVGEQALARHTSLFFSQASGDVERAVALGIARAKDVVVIGNGVDTALFAPDSVDRTLVRADLAIPDDALVALMVARLVPEKGVLDLADAALQFGKDPRVHVVLAGQALPSDRADVTAQLDAHPVVRGMGARWHRLGYRTDVARLLHAADIFALPSYREGLPRSIIEALACGVPVVASDIPACRELVEPHQTGLLVPVGDVDALAVAIAELLSDQPMRAQMGRRAREAAIARHDERGIIARQVGLLAALASR